MRGNEHIHDLTIFSYIYLGKHMVGLLLRQNIDYLMDALSHRLKYLREVMPECTDSIHR